MLKIAAQQLAQMRQADPDAFAVWILRHLVQAMPDKLRGIPVPLLLSQIDVAVARARGHGLSTDSQLLEFVAVMHEVAPNFDQEPALNRLLAAEDGDAVSRWESIFEATPQLELAWERAAHPNFYDHKAWLAPEDR